MKGIYARPVPIIVEADVENGVNASTLRIDDRYVFLFHLIRTALTEESSLCMCTCSETYPFSRACIMQLSMSASALTFERLTMKGTLVAFESNSMCLE